MLRQVRIEKVNKIDILIISTKFDFSTDYVCVELNKRNENYLRLNRDEFSKYKIVFDLDIGELKIIINEENYYIDSSLKSVYFRAPTYFRETYLKQFSTEEQLYNSQWMAFIRNLSYFEDAIWVNNPNYIYKAENKLLQLKYAKEIGFLIPSTVITNDNNFTFIGKKAVKSLDTAIFTINKQEAFFYTNILNNDEYDDFDKSLCPIVIQENLNPKIDYRVTVVGNNIYSTKIIKNNCGIYGDWRKEKEDINYISTHLPIEIENFCFQLLKKFNLNFGGIDLILFNDNFYFIEINPTGEWAWLVDKANQKIYEGICDVLVN